MNSPQPSYIEPTMFLFSDAKQLGQYVSFAVETSLQTRDYRTTSVTMYTVVGDLPSGRREVIAEFHAEGMATTFRDMAELAVKAL